MGNCLFGSAIDDFTRLASEEQMETRQPASRETRRESRHGDAPPAYAPPRHRARHGPPPILYHPQPGIQRQAHQLTEEEQIKIAQRIGLIQHLPTGLYYEENTAKRGRECAICMCDFEVGEQLRFLPCLHAYHKDCIDGWLMRSFTCPSCMEPVDAALLSSFD